VEQFDDSDMVHRSRSPRDWTPAEQRLPLPSSPDVACVLTPLLPLIPYVDGFTERA
jgi:hypothetical protein